MSKLFEITADTARFWRDRRGMYIFGALVFALSFSPAARGVPYLVLLGSVVVGVQAMRKDKEVLTEFICWLFFLTPLIRRVVDARTLKPEVLILTAPFLVLLLPLYSLLSFTPRVFNRRTAPFLYAISAVLYGAMIAFLGFSFKDVAVVMNGWLLPVTWGLYVVIEYKNLRVIRSGFERAMLGGTFVAGVYGIIQYFILPEWDALWLTSAELVTFGKPEAMAVRVFSTMNSPQILGVFLLVGLVLAYVSRSRWKYLVLAAGFSSLILSSARSSWLGFAGAVVYLAFRGTFQQRLRVLFVTVGCVVLLMGMTQVPSLSDAVTVRLQTFVDPKNDLSAEDRKGTYAVVVQMLSDRPVGYGLGVDTGFSDAEHDSSLVNLGLNLGFPGGLVLLLDILVLSFIVIFPKTRKDGSATLGLEACLVGLLVEIPVNNVVTGPISFLLWSLIAILYANVSVAKESTPLFSPIRRHSPTPEMSLAD